MENYQTNLNTYDNSMAETVHVENIRLLSIHNPLQLELEDLTCATNSTGNRIARCSNIQAKQSLAQTELEGSSYKDKVTRKFGLRNSYKSKIKDITSKEMWNDSCYTQNECI